MQNLSRRNFLTVAGAAAGSLALAGCNGGEQAADDAASADDAADTASDGEMTLVTEGAITFGVSPDYPPFENLENGEHVGLDMDLGRAIAEQLGLECVYNDQDFDSIIPAVVAGTIDAGLSGISITPERQEQVVFSDPYYVDNQAVATMADNADITEDNAAETLNTADVTIAVQSGSTGADFAAENFPNATQLPFPAFTDAFAAVNSGQADAVCGNAAVVNQMLAGAYTDMHTVLTSATGEEYAVAISKDNEALLDAVNGALKTLTDDGTIDQLISDNMG
ncbi:ABC transporter substrate-binding protein [Thermophilibacter sp.]